MRKIAFFVILVGIILIAVGLIKGSTTAGFFLIFPFISTNDPIAAIGFFLVFIGFLLLFLSPFYGEYATSNTQNAYKIEKYEKKEDYGGVILIGPFPIAFGSSEKLAKVMLIIGIAIFIFFFVLTILFFSF